jgi:sulfur carrier protein ThiS
MNNVNIEVKLYGMLRTHRPSQADGAPHHPFSMTVPDGTTAVQLAAQIGIAEGLFTAVAINNETAELDTVLQEGDQLSLFPPSAGGSDPLTVFIAGVMQSNRRDTLIDSQNYRLQIAAALKNQIPDVQIIDPWAKNRDSINYNDEQARHTFLSMTAKASDADLLIAYLPQPSMGTAMEMWQAYQADTIIIAVTPFVHHWAIRFTANQILPDLDALFALLENGRFLQEIVPKALSNRQS